MKFPYSDSLPEVTEEQEAERRQEMQRAGIKVGFSERLVMIGTAFLFLFFIIHQKNGVFNRNV